MGQPAYSNAIAQFDTTEHAANAYDAFKIWAEAANSKTNEDYSINEIELEDSDACISYTVDSMRYQNCIWQCEQIRDFFKKQEGCLEVGQDVMTIEDSVNWIKGDDEETP